MTDKSPKTDDLTLDQKSRVPATAAIGMNALKPMLHFQVSMLRMWADNLERFAGKYEQALDETATIVAEHSERERAV